ncbi:MAG TPA: TIGR01777 family oxidoreductase [Bacillales bacterium]|nr:TIGR01777 family oxidoreductase [Bacillales bacterium]
MHVAITGGTGFVGRALTDSLIKDDHQVSVLTRNPANKPEKPGVTYVKWLVDNASPANELENVDAIVNLAGTSINSGRWTKSRKKEILNSRIKATEAVINLIDELSPKPSVLANASAVGYYGMSESETFTEDSRVHAEDFLAGVAQRWEEEASKATQYDVRTVFCRFGVILGTDEGALPQMILPYKFGAGGTVGSGKQWLSWVHIDDVVGMIRFAIETREMSGPLNVTAPEPKRMKAFGKTIGEVLNRPHWMPVPGFAMKAALGEMSSLLLQGQRVLPEKAKQHGYPFHYPELKPALNSLLNRES